MLKLVFASVAALTLAPGPAVAEIHPHGDQALRAQAAITLAQAQRAALHARPGRIKQWELEREHGGSGLRYSFVIASRRHDYEVGIDARSGAVLENGREGANPD